MSVKLLKGLYVIDKKSDIFSRLVYGIILKVNKDLNDFILEIACLGKENWKFEREHDSIELISLLESLENCVNWGGVLEHHAL